MLKPNMFLKMFGFSSKNSYRNKLIAISMVFCSIAILGLALSQTQASLNSFITISHCQSNKSILNIDAALKCEYLPRNQIILEQGANQTHWIKLENNSRNINAPISIYVGPHFLKKIDFYESLNGKWESQVAGSYLSGRDSHAQVGGYQFISKDSSQENSIYYLRVQGSTLNSLDIKADIGLPAHPALTNWGIGIGIQLGGLMIILLFAIYGYLHNPSAVMWRFCLLMLTLLLCTLSGSGITAKYFLADFPWLDGVLFIALLCLRLATWTWVSQGFLINYQAPNWYQYACRIIYAICILCAVLSPFNQLPIIQVILLLGYLVAPFIQLIGVKQTRHINEELKKALVIGFSIASLLMLLAILVNVFPVGDHPLSIYISRMTDFISPLIFLALMTLQNRQVREELANVSKMLTEANLEKEFEQKILEERRILIDMLTHELKNPLASINLAIGSLNEYLKFEDFPKRRRIENIARSVNSMDNIIERVAFMNALDQKGLPITKGSHNLSSIIQSVIDEFPESERIQFTYTNIGTVEIDLYFLKIIVSNLIDNALKYSSKDSEIFISLYPIQNNDKNQIVFEVRNLISSEIKLDSNQIFKRYYRHPNANATSGSGLGLYLIKKIASIIGVEVIFEQQSPSVIFKIVLNKDE